MTSNTATPSGLEARPTERRPERTPAEIEAEIERTRQRLAGTVDAIADRVKPANVVKRTAAAVKAQFVDADGNPRPDRLAGLAAVTGLAGLLVWRRSH